MLRRLERTRIFSRNTGMLSPVRAEVETELSPVPKIEGPGAPISGKC